jgi:hypothetical protein
MHKALSAALVTIGILTGVTSWHAARAMVVGAQMPAVARSGAATPTPVAMICGRNGCAPVHVARVWHQPRGFAQRAAPLNMPHANPPPPPNTAASK